MNMNDADEKRILEMIKEAVKPLRDEIKKYNEKHEQDMKELKPYMQFATGLGIVYKVIVGIGAIAIAILAFKNLIIATQHVSIQ